MYLQTRNKHFMHAQGVYQEVQVPQDHWAASSHNLSLASTCP